MIDSEPILSGDDELVIDDKSFSINPSDVDTKLLTFSLSPKKLFPAVLEIVVDSEPFISESFIIEPSGIL